MDTYIWFRCKFVAVMNAITMMVLVMIQVFVPKLEWFNVWIDSPVIIVIESILFWLISPFAYRYFK